MGWERFDAPEFWRVNPTYTYYNTGDVDGVAFGLDPQDYWSFRFFVVNEVVTPQRPSLTKGSKDLGYGSSFVYEQVDPIFRMKLDFFYDVNTAVDITQPDGRGDVWTVSTSLAAQNILLSGFGFSYDFAWAGNANGKQIFVLSALRYDWDNSFLTFMLNYLDEEYDPAAEDAATFSGFNLFSNERVEYAVAYMINPVDDKRFRIGTELRWLDSNVVDEDIWGVYLQFLVMTESHTAVSDPSKSLRSW